MREIQFLMDSLIIKDTIGFAIFDTIPIEDHYAVFKFCKIIFNYKKMVKIKDDENLRNGRIKKMDLENGMVQKK
jgi:hypothetical protein